MMASPNDVIKRLRLVYSVEGENAVAAGANKVAAAQSNVTASATASTSAIDSLQRKYESLIRDQQRLVAQLMQQNQAWQTQATAMSAANDNVATTRKGFVDMAGDALSLAGHLKLAAAAAY